MLDDGPERERGEVLQAGEDQDDAEQQADEQRPIGRERAGRGRRLLLGRERPPAMAITGTT